MTQINQDAPAGLNGRRPGEPATDDRAIGEIIDIVAKETGLDRALLTPDATVDALGVSSLDMTQAIFALETHFDIELPVIPERAGAEFGTIGDLVAHVLATIERQREPQPAIAPEPVPGHPEPDQSMPGQRKL